MSPSSSRSHSEQGEIGVEGRDGEGGGTVEVEDGDEEEEVGGVDEREKLFKPANRGTSLGPMDTSSGGVEIQAGRPDIETLLTDAALATGSGSMSVNGMTSILSCACVWVTDVLGWSSSLWPTKSRGSRSAASSLVGVRPFGGVEGRSECRLVY